MLWHRRLAHALVKSIKDMFGFTINDCKSILDTCDMCPLAKHTRLPFRDNDSRSSKIFDLLHLDV